MTKYYYDDPLAAAWMAKHFGMKLLYSDGCEVLEEFVFGPWGIHPNSLQLLEPQIGDVVTPSSVQQLTYIGSDILVENMRRFPESTFMTLNEITSIAEKYGNVRVIQRNGVSFIWPEVEDD